MKNYDNSYGKKYKKANGGSDAMVRKYNDQYSHGKVKDGKIDAHVIKCSGSKTIFPSKGGKMK